MSKFGKITSDPPTEGNTPAPDSGQGGWFKRNQHLLAIASILALAFLIRFIYSYGVSSSSAFALSGGASASEHLQTITGILTSGFSFGADSNLFYPFGSASANPPLLDTVLALVAFIPKSMGLTAADSASFVLSWSAIVFGTLSCLPMYALAKDMLGSRKAGYLAALFLAFCPVVISQTVFSNGTEIGFVAFMFLLLSYFLYKGVSQLENGESAMKNSIICAIIMAVIGLSFSDIRLIILILVFCMAVALVIARFRSKDMMPIATFFSLPILAGALAGTIYFAAAGLLTGYMGVILAAVFSVLVCMIFAATQKAPWTLTIPSIVIGVIVVLVVLAVAAPNAYNALVGGSSFYAEGYSDIISNSLSFSTIATYFGLITMWFPLGVIVARLFKIGKNISSMTYVFFIVWMAACSAFAISSTTYAVIMAPAFAVAFAAVIIWLFKAVDIKSYASSFRGQNVRSIWKKIFRPVPFLAVIGVVLLVCVPMATTALDAASPSNTNGHTFNAGAIGYYVKTDSDWMLNDIFKSYTDEEKDGALVTWIEYSGDASAYGNFQVITDSRGNGSTAASNILLSNGVDGSSVSAMLIYLVKYHGIDESKAALGMTESQFNEFKNRLVNPSEYREEVLSNISAYGILRTDVSDENIAYISAGKFLTDNFSILEISGMYDAVCTVSSADVSYIMVSGSMFPLYYGYSSTFATLAYLNGYAMSDAYGTVAQFLKTDYYTQYFTGTYAYSNEMYDTLLWRAYIGKSPAEAGLTGTYDSHTYLQSLMLSDGTYKATPGYGLANFEVDYDHCYVSYNPDGNATLSSSGWVKTLYNDAIALQEEQGGLINYLHGYPVVLRYVSGITGELVTGTAYTVQDSQNIPVESIRVSVVDSNGMLRYIDFTDSNGNYSVVVVDEDSQIIFTAGATGTTGGTVIQTIDYNLPTSIIDVEVPLASISGYVDSGDVDILGMERMIKFTPTSPSGKAFSISTTDNTFSVDNLIPDTYTISVMDPTGKTVFATKTYAAAPGENNGLALKLDNAKITVTVKDGFGVVVPNASVTLVSSAGVYFTSGLTDANGVVDVEVIPGTYMFTTEMPGRTISATSITVAADEEKTSSVTMVPSRDFSLPEPVTGIISAIGYQGMFTYGEVKVPYGTVGNAVYGIYYAESMTDGADVIFGSTKDLGLSVNKGYVLKGKLTWSDAATTGWLAFMSSGNSVRMVKVNATTDGYSVLLPEGTYNVYGTNGSKVVYDTVTVSASGNNEKDFALVNGNIVSGTTSWYSSTNAMQYTPLDVKVTVGETNYTLSILSNGEGKYSFMVPSDATYEITLPLPSGGIFYFPGETEGSKVYSKTVTSASNFLASVEDIEITNVNDYEITVFCGDKQEALSPGAHAYFPIKSTSMTVTVDRNTGYYFNSSMPVEPAVAMDIDLTDVAVKYTRVDFIVAEGATLTIVNEEGDGDYATIVANKAYYFKDGCTYRVKAVTDGMIGYAIVDLSLKEVNIDMDYDVQIKGFVGIAMDGTITINEMTFPITSGSYNVTVPAGLEYYVEIEVSDNDKLHYVDSALLSGLSITDVNVRNFSVRGGEVDVLDDDEEEATITMDITRMDPISEQRKVSKVFFTVSVIAPEGAPTYLLSGGTAWKTIEFYADENLKNQLTHINGSTIFYGKGTIDTTSVAESNANLSVIVTDINGENVCTGTFETSENWARTSKTDATKVNYGADSADLADYLYAVKLTNDDNFTKTFTIELLSGIDYDKWLVTYVCDNEIVEFDATFDVPGYSSKTVYVKITTIDGSTSEIPEINIAVNGDYNLVTDEESGITISGTSATIISEKQDLKASVDYSASGRGVVTDKGSIPVYMWALVAAIVLMIILLIWLGIRRGVFTRKN